MKRLLLAVILCMGMLSMWAVPAKRITMEVKQPDGTLLTVTQQGDEFFSFFVTDDLIPVLRKDNAYFYAHLENGAIAPSKHLAHNVAERTLDEQQVVAQLPRMEEMTAAINQRVNAMRSSRVYRETEVPTMGEIHVPVILVEYADVKLSLTDAKTRFDNQFNGDDYKDAGGYGSVKEYFEDQSDGQFIPRFDIIGPVTLSKKRDYYGENNGDIIDPNAQAMITEACRLADESADFSKYDNNGDGYVDFLYVIYAGYGESANSSTLTHTVWPHKSQIQPLALDGVQVSLYACSNELDGYEGTNIDGIGTVCHEFTHCLGLPDFYATNYASGAFGMDRWSVLHSGNYNNGSHTPCGYTGYEKDFLGWKKLIVLNEPTDIVLKPMSEGGDAYKIVNDANPNEYYIIENHKKSKGDSHIPAEGMLVIHVDYSESAWQNNAVNNDPSHQRMTIIPADNKLTSSSLSGDVYPGSAKNTELTSTSTPAAEVYVGGYMGKDLTNITKNGDDVSLSFMKGALLVPKLNEATDITATGFSISWEQVPGIKEYEVQLDVLEENPYMLDEDFNKVTKTNSDIGGVMDKYTNRLGWIGEGIYGLDGAIRIGQAKKEGYLVSPSIACDSTHYTIFFKVRRNETATNDVYMVLGVGDPAWGNSLMGYGLTIDNDEWTAYYVVLDTIGSNTFLYIDTRDDASTTGTESMCVDLDDIYILPGDYRKQDPNYGAPARNTQYALCKEKAMPYQAQAVTTPATRQTTMREEESSEGRRYYATTVYTERTTELNFRFDNLDGALYRASVRSVRDSVYSRYSNTVDVEIVDSMLPQLELTIDAEMDNDSLYLTVEDADATIYYTLDGTIPTAYSNQYTGPLALKEKSTLKLMVRKEGYRRSDYFTYSNWFELEDFTYRIQSTLSPRVALTEAMGGNDESNYAGHLVIGNEVQADSLVYTLAGIDNAAFRNATALRSVTIACDAIEHVGSELFHGCSELIAVMWDIAQPITAAMFDANSYHNLLVYAPAGTAFSHPLIDEGRMALIVDGQAGTLRLNARKSFYCPRPFVAEEVSYERTFTQTTGKGESAGWETIALPFDVEKFDHAGKGEIAPFGTTATYNFWLAELTDKGFQQATTLRANQAYIIAMPNHSEYGNNTLNGSVTFSASQATIHATDEVIVSEGAELTLIPTYEPIAASDDVYALNIGAAYGNNKAGSIFMPGRYATNAFYAYGLPATGTQAAPYYRIHTQPDVEESVVSEFAVESKDGVLYITMPEAQTVVVYDMTGRQVCRVACETGINAITHLQPGIYMVEKTKVYVER